MGSILQDEDIIKLIRGADDNDMINDEELKDLITHLKSPHVGVKKMRHLMYLDMDDLPKSMTIVQKRILLYCFSNYDDGTTCSSYGVSTEPYNQAASTHSDITIHDNGRAFITVNNMIPYVSPSKSEAPSASREVSPISTLPLSTSFSPTKRPQTQDSPTGDANQKYVEKHETFLMKDEGRVQVVKMRSDGDCLFASVTHQIGSYVPYSQEHRLAIMTAREETVQYLRKNWRANELIEMHILDSCNQSHLCDYSGTESQKIEQYLTNLEEGKEWGGMESLKALAEQQRVAIKVFEEGQTSFLVTPLSVEDLLEIKVAFRKALDDNGAPVNDDWNHYDSVLRLIPRNNENSSDLADKSFDGEEERFTLVKQFFTEDEWASFCQTEKERFKNVYDRYLMMEKNGFYMKLPFFVLDHQKRSEEKKKEAQKRGETRTSVIPTRRSTRNATDNTDAEKVSIHKSPVQDSPKSVPENRETKFTSAKPNKKPRLFGRKLIYPTPLPDFGSCALQNLNKPAHSRNISPILFECKAFIREHLKSDYMEKSEYEDFSRTLVEKYPLLQSDDGEKPWWTFKKSLSASFRDDRKRKNEGRESKQPKLKKPTKKQQDDSGARESVSSPPPFKDDKKRKREGKESEAKPKKPTSKQQRVLKCPSGAETSVSSPDTHDSKMKQLSEAKVKKVIAKLLVETKQYRKGRYLKLSSAEKIDEYPHLKNPDMLLLDYLTSNGFVFEDLEENFLTVINLIGEHYEIDVTSQAGIMLAIAEMHKYFLTAAVKKGAKPVFTIVHNRSDIEALMSSAVQSPFLVVHIKNNVFIEEEKELAAAAIGMEGRMLLAMNDSPNAFRCLMVLIAVYNLFDLEYPQPYMEFLRALERFITKSVVKSKYGNTKKKFDAFKSLIENKKKPGSKKK